VVDLYNGVAVLKLYSAGLNAHRPLIVEALATQIPGLKSVIGRDEIGRDDADVDDERGNGRVLWGVEAPRPLEILERGSKFLVDVYAGQKTGFFLDQRENRKLLSEFSSGKKVLNTFCYTGGFSVYALQGSAALVHSVDASEKAIELTRKNIELNGFSATQHECFAIDTFEFLKDKNDVYDLIILDPPAFAKHRDARHQAVKGYQRLNAEAMKVIKKGGILFTFSCSQVVDRQLFYDTVVSAAIQAGRDVKVLYQLTQSPDHPVSMFHPEGEYLKGLVLYVA